MKKSALIYFLWSKNLSVLDRYLSNRIRVVITLSDYVTTEMQDIIRSRGGELVILQNLLSQSESHEILEKSKIAINYLSKNSENDWINYLNNLGINTQDFNLSLEKISETYLNSIFTIIECLKKAKDHYFIDLLVVSEEWLLAGKSAVFWAKAQGIPCLHLLHAVSISRYFMVHNKVVSDIIAAYGEVEIDSLMDIGVPRDCIRITGNPAWDQYPAQRTQRSFMREFIFKKYGLNETLPLIVFGTTWNYFGTAIHDSDDMAFGFSGPYDKTLYLFFKACKNLLAAGKPANFLIKDRPANAFFDGLSTSKELAKKAGLQSGVLFYATEDTAELVVAADVIISVGSNLSVEAMIAGTPAIDLLNDALLRLDFSYDAYSGILEVEPDQLPAAIISILENESFRNKLLELMRNKVNYYNIDDGKASIRVAELMAEMALDRSQFDYLNWLEKHTYPSCLREVKETKTSAIPSIQPAIHLIVIAQQDEEALLKQTCSTLENQQYENWRLTVIGDFQTDLEPALASHLFWKRVDALDHKIVNEIINSIIQEDSADWFGLMSAGLRFDPHSLEMIAAHIKLNPNWRLIYTDSDCIDPQDKYCEPQFRPDFNLDLLLSMPYIGEFCLAQRDALLEAGGFGIYPGAENYDLTLRIFDCFGEQAIGHIAELGYHVPKSLKVSSFDEEAGQNALLAHFARRGINASISQGYQSGIFFSDYHYDVQPSVSIIIPLKCDNVTIKSCIGSILSKTAYLNYELLLIDSQNCERSDIEDFLQELGLQERIFLIRNPKNNTPSTAINFAASRARGDYLLLLNDDVLVVQENWLERLLTYALRQDVGIVGCRLVLPDQKVKGTGVILGKQDAVACPVEYANLEDAGYMGRGWAAQNFSAITADCMLVCIEIFFQAGGLDEKNFPERFYDFDLCLKVKKQGYRIVWTPYVTLCRYHDASEEKSVTDRDLKSRKSFIKKWLPELANDPAYNRNLSLHQREWMIDGDFDTPWHPDLESLPRIVAQPPDEMGVGQYRVIGPIKELTNSGQICSFLLPPLNSDKRFLPSIPELWRAKPTTLLLQNAFSDFHLDDLQSYADLLPNIFRVFGQDDIVFSVPQKSLARKHFGKDTKARVRQAISCCHRVIVTNEVMAEALRDMIADIHVVPNYLERSRWGDLKPLRSERHKPRVGWAGAQQHGGDLEFILPVVEATANEVDWIFMGLCPPKLRYHVAEAHNAVPFDQYPATLATLDLDLAIAPLEINRFNAAKSNLRLLEYGAVGYPVICTDIQPYQNAPVTRVPNNPNAWIEAIREHIHDLDATHAAGDQLHTWVLSNWMLDQHLDEWLRALLPG